MARGYKTKIDKEKFEKLCAMQCTLEEISGFFNCSEDTIERWCQKTYKTRFCEIYSEKRQVGRISLRRIQWKQAETSTAMAIFLGKQYLGQRDSVEVAPDKSLLEHAADILGDIDSVIDK